ncbi:MAG TPA: enoyl-CoA hydratase/isomerase family protein, partial [Candidatus Acidoferrales bacterium]|nr:enoyl-CoA hydratase/isomerase family protein [Candidatus Acidoferrales bacterium]
MTTDTATVRVRIEGRTSWITLDRPPLNILDIAMMREMDHVLTEVLKHSDVIVFEGAGTKGFSAGAEVRDHTPDRVADMLRTFHAIFRILSRADCVTIAAVHGVCLGGGCELATFCDFVLATESARFGQPEIKLGCFPPVAVVTFPVLIGLRAAMDLILTGRTISAAEAKQLGLVTRVVPDNELAASIDNLLKEIGGLSSAVLKMTRRELWERSGLDFDKSLGDAEQIYLEELMQTEDAQEGIRAFLEKRSPVWHG